MGAVKGDTLERYIIDLFTEKGVHEAKYRIILWENNPNDVILEIGPAGGNRSQYHFHKIGLQYKIDKPEKIKLIGKMLFDKEMKKLIKKNTSILGLEKE